MVTIRNILTIFLLYSCHILFAQTNDEIQSKTNELENLKNQIQQLDKELTETKEKEKNTLKVLQKIDEQNLYLNKAINNLTTLEKKKEKQITVLNDSLELIQQRIESLQEEYGNYLKWIYMYGDESRYKLLFTSKSINQVMIRFRYLNFITESSESTLENLRVRLQTAKELKTKLEDEKQRQQELRIAKEKERAALLSNKSEKQSLVTELRKNKRTIENEIDSKRKAEISIKNLIAKLIEEEREKEKKAREERVKGNYVELPKVNYESFENFAELRGKLVWPVRQGRVIRTFGENKNPALNTVTLNYGIDISTSKDADVFAVADGLVSAIDWIPGYGSVIIITHRGNFRTVYGHVTDIQVNEGDTVAGGILLGKTNESLEGNIIHFEVWNERNYQNPEVWLSSR